MSFSVTISQWIKTTLQKIVVSVGRTFTAGGIRCLPYSASMDNRIVKSSLFRHRLKLGKSFK